MRGFSWLAPLSLGTAMVASLATAQEARTHNGVRLSKPPTLDGKIQPDEYPGDARMEGFVDPESGQPIEDATEAWLAYDDDAIYIAVRCRDSKPEGLIGRETNYGADLDDDDHVSFSINPMNQRTENGLSEFRVNLINTQSDEITGGRSAKREWRGEWTSATARDENGWSAEIRIPWKILQYNAGKGRHLDFNLGRYHPRRHLGVQWSNQGKQDRPEYLGIWKNVDLPPRKDRPRPEFLGYVAPEYDDPKVRVRAGLDVRYAVTPQSTGLLSINPDFKNIEGQVAGVEFTRSERFFEDNRPFFREGSGYYGLTSEYSFGQMFYPLRIEKFDYGAKYFGNLSPTAKVGVLGTVEAGRKSAAVANFAFNPSSKGSSSFYLTHSDEHGARSNTGYGGNYWTKKGNFTYDLALAGERDGVGSEDGAGAASIGYEVPNLFGIARYSWIDPKFSPSLAYIPFTDRRGGYVYTEHSREFRKGPIRFFNADVFIPSFKKYDGGNFNRGNEVSARIVTRNDIRFAVWRSDNVWFDQSDRVHGARIVVNDSNRYKQFGVSADQGLRGSKQSTYQSVFANYRIGKVDFGVSFNSLKIDKTEDLTIGTVGWEISPTRSLSARLVRRDKSNNAYLSFRESGGKGLEYFVIVGDPNANTWQNRVTVKLVWAF